MRKPVTKYCVISRNSRGIISRCCAIVFMGAAILEQQEQLAYKESFPTTHSAVYFVLKLVKVVKWWFSSYCVVGISWYTYFWGKKRYITPAEKNMLAFKMMRGKALRHFTPNLALYTKFKESSADSGFIQARLCKIQGLFKDFLKPLQQLSRTKS